MIVDEIHERDINVSPFFFLDTWRSEVRDSVSSPVLRLSVSLQTDFLMVVLRDVVQAFPDVRIVLMSATIDTSMFREYFFNCPVIEVFGRTFPVQGSSEDRVSLRLSVGALVPGVDDWLCFRVLPGRLHPDDQLCPSTHGQEEERQGRGRRRRRRKRSFSSSTVSLSPLDFFWFYCRSTVTWSVDRTTPLRPRGPWLRSVRRRRPSSWWRLFSSTSRRCR